MPDWIRTQSNQLHSLYAQLTDVNGPIDIPPGTIVAFHGTYTLGQENSTAPLTIGGSGIAVRPGATPDDPNRGSVRYDLSSSDVAQPGLFYCQWQLTPPAATTQSFPEDGRMTLMIIPAM